MGATFEGKVVTYDKIKAEKPHPNWEFKPKQI